MLDRRWLGLYAAVFAAAGAAFLLAPGPVTGLLAALTGAPAPGRGGLSLWLGLTGSLMAVLTLLAWELSRDPGQGALWRALLLSKAVSSLLFVDFAVQGGGAGYLAAALVDSAILVHLAFLREAHEPLDAWSPRLPSWAALRHEAWFLIFRDPASGDAFWLRYESGRGAGGVSGRCQWALTRHGVGVQQGARETGASKPEGTLFRAEGARLARREAEFSGPGASWKLSWDEGPVPSIPLVPRWLWRLGAAGTMYVSAAPAALFSGTVTLGERTWTLAGAPGCVGHLWGRRHGARWLWAHAYWPERGVMVETLAAQGRLGRWLTPVVKTAALWRDGRLSRAAAFGGVPSQDGGAWTFRAGGVSGTCRSEPRLTCELAHEGVLVRHCTAGSMKVEGVAEAGPAAVESAEEA
ncbi:MAG: hypothetical protein HYV15_07945 [Elusimicrobia bacterium]|nr:hypothetical protein [Elusimicrobiota bacterium]